MSRPLIVAAGLDPEQRQRRPAQRPRDQRLRRDRADRLRPVGPDPGGGQREPGPGRGRARARSRRRRRCDPQRERREGGHRDQHPVLVLGALAIAAGAGDAGMGIMQAGQRAALGELLAFTRAQERPPTRPAPVCSPRPGSAARACSTSSASCRTRNIGSPSTQRTASTAPTRFRPNGSRRSSRSQDRSRLEQADRSGARSALPAGQGQAARLRRSQAGGHQISRKRPERPGPLRPRLCLSPRRLSRKSDVPRPTRCSRPIPHDPFFLELKGQILLEGGKPQGGDRRRCARRPSGPATRR